MPSHRPSRACRLALLAALAACLAPAPASAWPEDAAFAGAHARTRHHEREVAGPPIPRTAIVSGYLPRNNNVPMYNQPPRRERVFRTPYAGTMTG